MAPEVDDMLEQQSAKGYNEKCDIYSIGVTAIYLFVWSGKLRKDVLLIEKVKKNTRAMQRMIGTQDVNFVDFIKQCISTNAAQRPSATKLLDAQFFKKSAE